MYSENKEVFMSGVRYKIPAVKTYSAIEIAEIIGPTQAGSMTVEGWRGTKLEGHKPYEYRFAESQNVTKIARLNLKGGIENV